VESCTSLWYEQVKEKEKGEACEETANGKKREKSVFLPIFLNFFFPYHSGIRQPHSNIVRL
jgi:hypothetical protein